MVLFRRSAKVSMQIDHEPMLFYDRLRSRAHGHGLHGGGSGSRSRKGAKPPAVKAPSLACFPAVRYDGSLFGTPNYSRPSTLTLSLAQWLISSNCHFWTASYMQMLSAAQRFFPESISASAGTRQLRSDWLNWRERVCTLDGQLRWTSTLFSASWYRILI